MKPFHFSLQAVRTLRQRQEQISLEAFGRAVQARTGALEKQNRKERDLHQAWRQLEHLQVSGANVRDINQVRGHCQVLQQGLAQAQQFTAAAQQVANEAWETLNESRQQLELVSKFYERRRDEYERELRQEEQKQLDEMAGRRWHSRAVMVPSESTWN